MELKFGVNDSPPLKHTALYSFQHLVTMLGATIVVPIILATQLKLSASETGILISNVLFCMGIATCLQSALGTKLPIVQGSSFAFLPVMLLIIAQNEPLPDQAIDGANVALRYISGTIILGAIFQFFLGYLGIAGKIQKLLTPVVVGPVIIAIGLSLFKTGANQAGTDWKLALLTIVLVFVFTYFIRREDDSIHKFSFILSSIPVLSSVIIVYSICLILSISGIYTPIDKGFVSLEGINTGDWFRTELPVFTWGFPIFSLGYFLTILIAYAVITFESIGDYNAVAEISDIDDNKGNTNPSDNQSSNHDRVSEYRVNKGIIVEGIGNIVTGIVGGVPTTSYAENVGLVAITRVASRSVVFVTGIILIISGYVPNIGNLFNSIPQPVMGGLYCILLGTITGIGVKITAKTDTKNMRNISIIGFTMFMSFCIPEYFSKFVIEGNNEVRNAIIAIGRSHMAVAATVGLVLDIVIPDNIGGNLKKAENGPSK
ncbi:MAG: solute carrier family 23 protein [Reichenbachiella sp.]|uniref:uracil-xanthine permease family protein n=1 Tax=Reichenbachiella sp. TaxID=2184521 RepID=UPI0032632109